MLVGIGGVLQIGRHQLVAHGVEVGQLGLQLRIGLLGLLGRHPGGAAGILHNGLSQGFQTFAQCAHVFLPSCS